MNKKRFFGMLCLMIVLLAIPIKVSAYSFSLYLPDYFVGSMRSTYTYEKTSTSTPYVDPSINTLPTAYFLSPKQVSAINSTNVVTISDGTRQNFSWESGYGGVGTFYCLSAYPNMSGDWNAYTTEGTWSN